MGNKTKFASLLVVKVFLSIVFFDEFMNFLFFMIRLFLSKYYVTFGGGLGKGIQDLVDFQKGLDKYFFSIRFFSVYCFSYFLVAKIEGRNE